MSGAGRRAIKRIAEACGVEVTRLPPGAVRERGSLVGSLKTAARIGFSPAAILDVGAARGEWTLEAALVWPGAKFLLVDPLEENRAALTRVVGQVRNAAFEIAAVGREVGSTTIHVHPDLDGSSLYEEREETIAGSIRSVAMTTVDQSVLDHELDGPYLLKADVQGAELAVVEGAAATLAATEFVVLEVSLFDFFLGAAPQLEDLVAAMGKCGFVAWDIFGIGYRPIDGALAQVDMVFVRRDGMFRRIHQYATEEQRREQLACLAAERSQRVRHQDA
jgi:FkbM family methyltransferase